MFHVHFTNVLFRPSFPEYDQNQLETVMARKRRQSNDSMDSGTSEANHHHYRAPSGLRGSISGSSLSPSPPKKRSRRIPSPSPPASDPKRKRTAAPAHPPAAASSAPRKATTPSKATRKASSDASSVEEPRIKLDGSFNNTTTYSIRNPAVYQQQQQPRADSRSDHQHNASSSEEASSEEEEEEDEESSESSSSSEEEPEAHKNAAKKTPRRLSKSAGVNPVTGRPLWTWVSGDEGYRRPGSKGKAKKLFHKSVQRGPGGNGDTISVGDCALFLSEEKVERPYIGKVETLWETPSGLMRVKVKWFYHPEEVVSTGKKFELRSLGGLFNSPHTDENDVQTISHKCRVLPLKEYTREAKRRKSGAGAGAAASDDLFYLAGSYDPSSPSINFMPGVLK